MYLDELELGQEGRILEIKCNENVKRRLLDLGIVKGTKITPILKNPLGDPRAYEIRGSIIAIRKEDTRLIKVERR